ncbi:unnamed protein product, partial [Mesorhabditis belari]|uniref:Uncharacterized protein n=1 Tax=Mesorhabditis belari TaxID=2138241 RepID=A0AAF3FNB0_9BILA
MGHCTSKDTKDQKKLNRRIEEQIRKDQSMSLRIIKLLLLGAGESGKSTILKQMRILHKDGFSQQDLEMIRPVVYSNCIHSMLSILRAMFHLQIEYGEPERVRDSQLVFATVHANKEELTEELASAMQRLWADSGVPFLDNLPRLSAPNYVPTEQDLLRTRIKTTGITEVLFELKGLTFRVIDVGGQRSERKKWIHCFDNVNAIIFISSLSEYDQTLREDNCTNRMQESLKLFDSICNSPWFADIHFILFLNKKDLFAEKIQRSPLTICFPEYKGQQNQTECINYIQWKFEQLNRSSQREIYCHHTCATDTNNVQFVLDACLDMIIAKNLKTSDYQTETFAVSISPTTALDILPRYENGPNLGIIALDCFHFSRAMQDAMAKAIWRNVLEHVDNRSTFSPVDYEFPQIACPAADCPYLRTIENSISCVPKGEKKKTIQLETRNMIIDNGVSNIRETSFPFLGVLFMGMGVMVVSLVSLVMIVKKRRGIARRAEIDETSPLLRSTIFSDEENPF